MQTDENSIFEIFVDRVEGKFAVCEFPDGNMKDICLSVFPCEVREKHRYRMRYDEKGKIQFVEKVISSQESISSKTRLPSRFLRFSKKRKVAKVELL